MTNAIQQISDNVQRVRERMARAAERSGRAAEAIQLVAVTKYVGAEEAAALLAAGCHDLAESRPQALWHKAAAIDDPSVRWHLVGHLQRNKVRRTLPLIRLLHSGDSERLLTAVSQFAEQTGAVAAVLLEVNISGEEAKHGFAAGELADALTRIAALPHLEIRGLMAMASLHGGLSQARDDFRRLRELRDRLRSQSPPALTLDELSMGMSNDFEVAIEEGATMVRVGSALFEGLNL